MDSVTQDVSWKRKLQRIYEFNLSSTVWSAGGFVAFRAVCSGNCSRMLWIELPACYFYVLITNERQNKSTISIINHKLIKHLCCSTSHRQRLGRSFGWIECQGREGEHSFQFSAEDKSECSCKCTGL